MLVPLHVRGGARGTVIFINPDHVVSVAALNDEETMVTVTVTVGGLGSQLTVRGNFKSVASLLGAKAADVDTAD